MVWRVVLYLKHKLVPNRPIAVETFTTSVKITFFVALCVFFTNLFLSIMLLYLVLVDCIKYCKSHAHRMYSVVSVVLNVSIAAYLTVGLKYATKTLNLYMEIPPFSRVFI